VFPDEYLVDTAARFSQDRAGSLKFRFDNEEILYEKAMERPLFGWGGWGRSRVYDKHGEDISTPDGKWVILLGVYGLFGFLTFFGMLTIPIFQAHRSLGRVAPANQVVLAALSLLAACYAVDMLPNAGYAQIPIFVAGAVSGLAKGMAEEGTASRFDPRVVARVLGMLRRMPQVGTRQVGTR
jgi:hypothetical protein